MASSEYSTRASVRSVGGAPALGYDCVKLAAVSAVAHAASSSRPSMSMLPVARAARSVRTAVHASAFREVVSGIHGRYEAPRSGFHPFR
jgi:hypothetical protein